MKSACVPFMGKSSVEVIRWGLAVLDPYSKYPHSKSPSFRLCTFTFWSESKKKKKTRLTSCWYSLHHELGSVCISCCLGSLPAYKARAEVAAQ